MRDQATSKHLLNGIRLLRISKEQGLTKTLMLREQEIRGAAEAIDDPLLRAEVIRQCDALLDTGVK